VRHPFEHREEPLLPRSRFLLRQLRYAFYGAVVLSASLLIGVAGYMLFAELSFIDALLNASMILTGMGPVDQMRTDSAKLFASCYALFSGVAFLTTIAVLLAPAIHRLLHRLHIDAPQ
jgi:hypothetical protein